MIRVVETSMSYKTDLNLSIDCIDKNELLNLINKGSNCVIVDTIGKYDGNKFKIRGAYTIPYPEVVDRRKELVPYDEIIIYCRNKRCKASKKAALGLKLLNIPNVKIYEGGIDEWVESGLPVEEE
ncbi:MAG TPA: hypothetical protein ENG75_00355 [Nitrospirae bacterium]|nr:hypothetical protein [Nitrospirota bacterium]